MRLRQECGQLRADWADLLAQCQAASSELAAAKADNAALRQVLLVHHMKPHSA